MKELLEELGRRLEIRGEDLNAKREELSVIKDSTAAEEESPPMGRLPSKTPQMPRDRGYFLVSAQVAPRR